MGYVSKLATSQVYARPDWDPYGHMAAKSPRPMEGYSWKRHRAKQEATDNLFAIANLVTICLQKLGFFLGMTEGQKYLCGLKPTEKN